jgi:hypothetical protein
MGGDFDDDIEIIGDIPTNGYAIQAHTVLQFFKRVPIIGG